MEYIFIIIIVESVKEREESRIIPPTNEIQISRGGENQPGTNVESSSSRAIDATRNPECFCNYEYKHPRVKVQTRHRLLAERDAVELNETVSLECVSPNYRLKWKNGLVFSGKAYMTCSMCKQWQREDLPTCTRATSDSFIQYDGDFKILPGGIIDIRRGERRQYECRSSYSQPVWDFGDRQNVRTRMFQVEENKAIVYVTSLDILEASDQHNGQYECFLRDDFLPDYGSGTRIGSTFFNLHVHEREESRIIPPTDGIQIPRGEENQPGTNVESSSSRAIDATRNPECFCNYEYKHPRVKVQTRHRLLAERDAVELGETVSLECVSPNYRLKWKNGLVFSGKAYMTCSMCKQWQREDLPTCTRATSDSFIQYDGDFKILPGGIIDIRRGERRQYECRSSYSQPVWDFGDRQNVRTRMFQLEENKAIVFVTFLDILEASDQHNGQYECFLRGDDLFTRVGSTFFNLQVHDGEDRSITTTEPGVAIGDKVTQPSVNVETSSPQKSDPKRNEDCFCTYEYEDQFVNAQIGQKALNVGDTIRRGETVSFECKYVGMALTWQNGLRLHGAANLICSTCKKWQRNDVPICKYYLSSDAIITFNGDLNVLPGGTTIIKKGDRNQFNCINGRNYPEWDYGQRRGVSVTKSQVSLSGNLFLYLSTLNIGEDENAPSGKYECYMNDTKGQRIGSTFLHLQAYETDILCPPIDRSGIFILRYSNQRRINSTVTFYCKDDGKRIEGRSCLTCLPNGTWSGEIPKCVDYASCPEFTLTPGLNVIYSKNLSVGSTASFECSLPTKDLNGSSTSTCQEDGSWSNPLPSCEDQKCSMHNLTMSVPKVVEPDISEVTEAFVILGFEVKLKCADRSVIIGDSKAKCEKQGKWKLGSFQCVPGCILNLDQSSNLLVEPKKEVYRVGERILLACPRGEELSSDVEQLMCLPGFWSDDVPTCNEVGKKSGL